jgi:hypothetical protein
MLDDLPLAPPVPSWNDLYLRFADADEADVALANLTDASIDIIGTIYKPTGNMVETEMGEMPEMAALPGWHVNVRLRADQATPDSLVQYSVTPQSPVRVWA